MHVPYTYILTYTYTHVDTVSKREKGSNAAAPPSAGGPLGVGSNTQAPLRSTVGGRGPINMQYKSAANRNNNPASPNQSRRPTGMSLKLFRYFVCMYVGMYVCI